jgi:alcohol dehydrogenase
MIVQGVWPLPYPIALGHEFTAEVIHVGQGVGSFRPGQRVAVPFQVSCGSCGACARNFTGNCTSTPHRATYGFGEDGGSYGGALSDRVLVPFAEHMLVAMPDGVSAEAAASAGDNMADGFASVAPGLEQWPEGQVLVIGGGAQSIALFAVDAALALGASRVVYLDQDPGRLKCAEALGAEAIDGEVPRRVGEKPGEFQVTADGSGSVEGLQCAVRSTAPDGVCTCAAGMIHRKAEMPVSRMYEYCATFRSGRVHARPAMPVLLDLIAEGRLRPELIISDRSSFDEAAEALLQPYRKLLVTREAASAA